MMCVSQVDSRDAFSTAKVVRSTSDASCGSGRLLLIGVHALMMSKHLSFGSGNRDVSALPSLGRAFKICGSWRRSEENRGALAQSLSALGLSDLNDMSSMLSIASAVPHQTLGM
jgi:hypothetical protein